MTNRLRSIVIWGVVLLLLPAFARAQQDAVLTNYRSLLGYYNPAFSGLRNELFLTAAYHQQWIGIKGAPMNIAVLADAPIKVQGTYLGVGLSVLAQKKGLYTNTEASAQAAYAFPLLKGKLSIGAQVGLFNTTFDGTKVEIPDGEGLNPNDPSIPLTAVSGKTFDAAAGLYYTHPKFYSGVAVRHIPNGRVRLDNTYYLNLPISMNAVVGYNIMPKNSLLSWHPSVFALTDFHTYRVDLNLDVHYAQKFEAGLMFRPLSAAGLRLGMNLGKVHLGYAFEMPINELVRGNYGSHEVVVSYSLPLSPAKEKTAQYKSIRLL